MSEVTVVTLHSGMAEPMGSVAVVCTSYKRAKLYLENNGFAYENYQSCAMGKMYYWSRLDDDGTRMFADIETFTVLGDEDAK